MPSDPDDIYRQIAVVLRLWAKQASAPACPCCALQMVVIDRDRFGTMHCRCTYHGPYTLQVAA